MRAAGAGAAGAAADAAKLLCGAHLSTQDASRERVTSLVRFDETGRAFEHDAYEFDAARDEAHIDRAFSNTIISCVLVARETTHLRAARNATIADNDMIACFRGGGPSLQLSSALTCCERGKEWADTNGGVEKRGVQHVQNES